MTGQRGRGQGAARRGAGEAPGPAGQRRQAGQRDEEGRSRPDGLIRPGRPDAALGHPLRVALLDLLAERATVTATEAAAELGESSGACSFHLRQLERYGHVEEVPVLGGRARPWRLAVRPAGEVPRGEPRAGKWSGSEESGGPGEAFGVLARELENEGYRRWLAGRASAPPGWRDEAFSAVLRLTPDELSEVAAAIRAVIAARGEPGGEPGSAGRGGAGRGGRGAGG
jgi:DNA-binding transcriptional ArsR family regulator